MTRKNVNLYSPRPRVPQSPRQTRSRPVLHRARLVVPVTQPAIENGAVAVAEGVILDVGPFQSLRRLWPEAQLCEQDETALIPALVNAHAHLDLSGLAGQVQANGGMAQWIRGLLAAREQLNAGQLELARTQALSSMRSLGTGIVGDISSSVSFIQANAQGMPLTFTFVELLGLHTHSLEAAFGRFPESVRHAVANGHEGVSLAAHAPYTASAALIRAVKTWGSARRRTVSIHAAESEEETLFLLTGRGPLRDLLEERGMDPSRWQPPGCGAVTYLDRLGFLDPLSLCVHVVQASDEEIHLLRRSGAGVCLCPRSNLFLGHGLPPVGRFLQAGIPCGLGTDSLASNDDLNLFQEMAVLMDRCGIGSNTALAMATIHGARSLGVEQLYGSLEKGKRWLALRVAAMDGETMVAAGRQGALEWLT